MQRWIHDQGWTSLHDAQERAIDPILDGDRDIIIAAATAAGKTEAAVLPILSSLATAAAATAPAERDPWTAHDPWAEPETTAVVGVQVLYLSPLKALINDQYQRLEQLCERADIAVHRWHGDVSGSSKQKMLADPSGVLLITPESLEATFVNRGTQVPALFAGLRYVVIDELHSFLATPRGAQLQSLIGRVELAIRRRPPRIGLSATLGDMMQAALFLRPADPERVVVVESKSDGRAFQLQLRGYVATPPAMSPSEVRISEQSGREVTVDETTPGDETAIAEHLFRHLRGQDNLIFANTRTFVEIYSDLLARRSDRERVPNEFAPHHGNLSKDMRETVEAQLKDRTRPATAVCTSTLEMGIDIGSVVSVAQIGPPPSVASLRQRLGRSGRRDADPAVLRLYVSEKHLDQRSSPVDELRCSVVQTTAMVRLLLGRWLEAPDDPGFNYSTLIQQIMSTIAQHGGATAAELHRALCGPGPFQLVDQARFVRLLQAMAAHDLLIQASDGLLLHGAVGERHVNHYSFYTAFQTSDEWRLVTRGKTLGTVPIYQPLYEGVLLIFAGKRWKVTDIDTAARIVDLERSSGGNPPQFGGNGAAVSDRIRTEMVAVYESTDTPAWLDTNSQQLLAEGRTAFARFGLSDTTVLAGHSDLLLLPWTGDRALFTAMIALLGEGIEASVEGPAIQILGTGVDEVAAAMRRLLADTPPEAGELAAFIQNREIDKWDWVLDDTLACESAGARLLDVDGAWTLFAKVAPDLAEAAASTTAASPAVERLTATPAFAPPPTSATSRRLPPPPPSAQAPVPAPAGRQLAHTNLSDHEFCVLDVETTGFSPRLGDRVVEIATVRMRGDGTVLAEWSTLIDPGRDIGAGHVHGVTATDVVGAPSFADVVGDILHHVSDAVLVAHNFRFDRGFLAAEFTRAGLDLPEFPALCTLSLGSLVQPGGASRRLKACCDRLGIDLPDEHDALADARATAKILAAYLAMAVESGRLTLDEIGCVPLVWPDELPAAEPSARRQLRGAGRARIASQGQYLASLVHRLDDTPSDDPDTAAYLELLDRALEDRRLTDLEADALTATAAEWGLSTDRVKRAHEQYFNTVLHAAWADGVITDLEHRDLQLVGSLLCIDHDTLERRIKDAELIESSADFQSSVSLMGLSVCFTGALFGRINSELITRDEAHRLAEEAGLVIRKNVSKGLDLLVVADPDSQSGKARRARELGTRVMAEAVFWSTIGVTVD